MRKLQRYLFMDPATEARSAYAAPFSWRKHRAWTAALYWVEVPIRDAVRSVREGLFSAQEFTRRYW